MTCVLCQENVYTREMKTDTRNVDPTWTRDEVILALDLYYKHNPQTVRQEHPEVIKLSNILNAFPIHPQNMRTSSFRNPNAVYMKLCNFLNYDPEYTGKGLDRGSKLDKQIWREFSNDKRHLSKLATSILSSYRNKSVTDYSYGEEEDSFPEGKVLYRRHKSFERNSTAVKRVKSTGMANGNLVCSICDFDFLRTYGEIGKGFIECHHTTPVSKYGTTKSTRIADLVLVCSNCHRMLHRKRPWLTIDDLKALIT